MTISFTTTPQQRARIKNGEIDLVYSEVTTKEKAIT